MAIHTRQQLIFLLVCLLSGLPLGIIYDFLRAVRHRVTYRIVYILSDCIFALVWFITLFIIGYTISEGVQRFYAPVFSLSGLILYFIGLSPLFLGFFRCLVSFSAGIFKLLFLPFSFTLQIIKKLYFFSKNFFYSKKKCYTIKKAYENAPQMDVQPLNSRKGTSNETEKGRYYY